VPASANAGAASATSADAHASKQIILTWPTSRSVPGRRADCSNETVREAPYSQPLWRVAWALSGAGSVVLFGLGLIFGDLVGTTNFPPLDATAAALRSYFLQNQSDVRALAFFHLLAALALLAFAAYLYDELRSSSAGRAALALAGGGAAAVFLLLSALCYRVLAEPAVARDPALAHGLVVTSYLAGGPAITVPLALAAIAVVTERLVPGWSRWLALAAAIVGLACATTILGPTDNRSATYGILLLGAALMFAWLLVTSLLLARRARLGAAAGG
jgi:hypothetical protein